METINIFTRSWNGFQEKAKSGVCTDDDSNSEKFQQQRGERIRILKSLKGQGRWSRNIKRDIDQNQELGQEEEHGRTNGHIRSRTRSRTHENGNRERAKSWE